MAPSTSVTGLSVAVTGAANGIGRAVAETFSRAGARVAIGDIDGGAAESVAESLGPGTLGVQLDVTNRDAFARFLDAAEDRHGPLDVMINNAGIDWIGPFHEEPDDVSRREIDVNLFGTIIGSLAGAAAITLIRSLLSLQIIMPDGSSFVLPQHWMNVFIGLILIGAVVGDIWIRQEDILSRIFKRRSATRRPA